MREAPEDCEAAIEQLVGLLDFGATDVAPGSRDLQRAARFGGAAGGDAIMLEPIATFATRALGYVERQRRAGAPELTGQIAVVLRNGTDERAERGDRVECELLSFESCHRCLLVGCSPPRAAFKSPKRPEAGLPRARMAHSKRGGACSARAGAVCRHERCQPPSRKK